MLINIDKMENKEKKLGAKTEMAIFGIVIFFGILVYNAVDIHLKEIKNRQPTMEVDTIFNYIQKDTFSLNMEGVYKKLVQEGILYPKVVLKQAICETGHFESDICLNNKNLFGFCTNKGYLMFETYEDCIKYYKDWQMRHYKGGDYYSFLKDYGYAEDTNYVSVLKQIRIDV